MAKEIGQRRMLSPNLKNPPVCANTGGSCTFIDRAQSVTVCSQKVQEPVQPQAEVVCDHTRQNGPDKRKDKRQHAITPFLGEHGYIIAENRHNLRCAQNEQNDVLKSTNAQRRGFSGFSPFARCAIIGSKR